MRKNIITPVLVKYKETLFKILYIKFGNDGSIYLLFPRKEGYKCEKYDDIPNPKKGKNVLFISNKEINYIDPYLSYHPAKKVIHINSSKNQRFKLDGQIANFSKEEDKLCFPLCQIVIPRFDIFDEYRGKKKYKNPLILVTNEIVPEKHSILIELWVHPNNSWINPEELPPKNHKRNLFGCLRYDNKELPDLSCTAVFSLIEKEDESCNDCGITCVVITTDWRYVFQLDPM